MMAGETKFIEMVDADKIRAARRQTPGEKLLAGISLFADVKRRMCEGIRWQHPDLTEEQVQRELRRRLAIARQIENRPCESWTPSESSSTPSKA